MRAWIVASVLVWAVLGGAATRAEPLDGTTWRPLASHERVVAGSDPALAKKGSTFTFAGAVRLRIDDRRIGAWTGFDVDDDGRLLAVTDAGYLVRGQIELGEQHRLKGVAELGTVRARDTSGAAVSALRQPQGVALTFYAARVYLASPATVLTYADVTAPAQTSSRPGLPQYQGGRIPAGVAFSHSFENAETLIASAEGVIVGCSMDRPTDCLREAREDRRMGPLAALRQFSDVLSLHDAVNGAGAPAWTLARRKTVVSCDVCVGDIQFWQAPRPLLRLRTWAEDYAPVDLALWDSAAGPDNRLRVYLLAQRRDDPQALLLIALDWDFLAAQPDDRDTDAGMNADPPNGGGRP